MSNFYVDFPDRRFYAPILSRSKCLAQYKGMLDHIVFADDLVTLEERVRILYSVLGSDLTCPETRYVIVEDTSEEASHPYQLLIDKYSWGPIAMGPYMEGILRGWYARGMEK